MPLKFALKSFVSDAEDTFRYHSGNRSLIPPYVSSFSSGGNFVFKWSNNIAINIWINQYNMMKKVSGIRILAIGDEDGFVRFQNPYKSYAIDSGYNLFILYFHFIFESNFLCLWY